MKILFHSQTGALSPYPRPDDEPAIGLDPAFEIFDLIQEDAPAHDAETHTISPTEVIDVQARTVMRGYELIERIAAPPMVTMASFRLAMGPALLADLQAAIDGIINETQRFHAQTLLEYRITVSRAHPLVTQLATMLQKTDEEVDAIFAAAMALDQG